MKILLLAGAALAALSLSRPEPLPVQGARAGSYTVDGGHSSVVFVTRHLDVSRFYGRFNEVAGELELNEDELGQSRVTIEIPAASIDTNSENRDAHLKSPDFFSAKEFPVIAFESTAIEGTRDALEIRGRLSLRGETRPVTATGRIVGSGETMFGDYRAGFEARLSIAPAEYGFSFMEKNPEAVGPEVEVVVSLECIRN